MIYKGLLGRDELKYLRNRFKLISFRYLRTGTEITASDEMLAEADISSEVYNNIVNDDETGSLTLISHSQGLMSTSYEIHEDGYTMANYIKQRLVRLPHHRIIFINLLGSSVDTKSTIGEKDMEMVTTTTSNRGMDASIQNFNYRVFTKRLQDTEKFNYATDFSRVYSLLQKNIGDNEYFLIVITKDNNEYGIKFTNIRVSKLPGNISTFSNSKGINVRGDFYERTEDDALFFSAKNSIDTGNTRFDSNKHSEMVNEAYILQPSIDFPLEFDEKYGISPEAFPLFRRWAKGIIKRKIEAKYKTVNRTLPVFSIKNIDSSLHSLFDIPLKITSKKALFTTDSFEEWAKRKLVKPKGMERVEQNLAESVKILMETTGKFKPLSRTFFTDKKNIPGKELLSNLITAYVGLALGDRSGFTSNTTRPPSVEETDDLYNFEKAVKQMNGDLEFLVDKSNKKGYEYLTDTEKLQLAIQYEYWVDSLDMGEYKVFIVGQDRDTSSLKYLANNLKEAGVYPYKIEDEDSIFSFGIKMFADRAIRSEGRARRIQLGKTTQTFIFIINYERQEISVNKFGGQDDARQFSKSFQDFDIRLDILNLINRIISEPKNLITNLSEEPYYTGRAGDSPLARVSMTPESTAFKFGFKAAQKMKNNPDVIYFKEPKEDTLTGKREGFMVFREDRGGFGLYPFDPYYHDKDGHGEGITDICITPLSNLFSDLLEWADTYFHNGYIKLSKIDKEGWNRQIMLDFLKTNLKLYLNDMKPEFYPIAGAVCIRAGGKYILSPDMNAYLGQTPRGGDAEVFPIDVNALGPMPRFSIEQRSSELFMLFLLKARDYHLGGTHNNKNDDIIISRSNLVTELHKLSEDIWKNTELEILKDYLKTNPPIVSKLAARRT